MESAARVEFATQEAVLKPLAQTVVEFRHSLQAKEATSKKADVISSDVDVVRELFHMTLLVLAPTRNSSTEINAIGSIAFKRQTSHQDKGTTPSHFLTSKFDDDSPIVRSKSETAVEEVLDPPIFMMKLVFNNEFRLQSC